MDIVERLREWKNSPLFNAVDLDPSEMEEAADEIERLRETLREIAHFNLYGDYSNAYEIPEIARAALKEGE
jgi:hypothetical protein